jgi:hAT family C-terminal dimerisation region
MFLQVSASTTNNIFYNLSFLAPPKLSELRDELDHYLSTDPELVRDFIGWWYERQNAYPQLSHMALDYLMIPGKLSQHSTKLPD